MDEDYKAVQETTNIITSYIQQSMKIFRNNKDKLLAQQDIEIYNTVPMLRGKYKNFKIPEVSKEINGFRINNQELQKSPFDILKLKPNRVQEELLKVNFEKAGSYLFNISCGGGKTLVGIEWIHRLKFKTLIISARSAVNDQWLSTLRRVYPSLNVSTRTDKIKKLMKANILEVIPDVYIVTPQYLAKIVKDFKNPIAQKELSNFKFDMIIYDEIHSLLSKTYSYVLALPYILKMIGLIKRIPVLLGLTASLPSSKSTKYQLLYMIFGNPISLTSEVTKIPIDFIDFRDTVSEEERKWLDSNYKPLTSCQAIKKAVDYMIEHNIKPSIDYKLIIMTPKINDSVYAACYASSQFDLPVVLVRTENECDYYFEPELIPDEYLAYEELSPEDQSPFTLEAAVDLEFMEQCKYRDILNKVGIIVSTTSRLKEGFNCENICFGICTEFIYSDTSRIQILGRIRRSSTNEKLNAHTRLFIVNSGRMKSTLTIPKYLRRGIPPHCTYDFDRENELFYEENYNRYNFNTYQYKEFRNTQNDRIITDIKKNTEQKKIKITRNENINRNVNKNENKNQNNIINQINPLMIKDISNTCFRNQQLNQRQNINQNQRQNINQNVNYSQRQNINQNVNYSQKQNINQNVNYSQKQNINQQPQLNINQLNQQQLNINQRQNINQNVNYSQKQNINQQQLNLNQRQNINQQQQLNINQLNQQQNQRQNINQNVNYSQRQQINQQQNQRQNINQRQINQQQNTPSFLQINYSNITF